MERTSLCDDIIDSNSLQKRKKKRKLSGLDVSIAKQGESILVEGEKNKSSLKIRLKEDVDTSSKLKGHDGHCFACEECHHGGNLLCCDSCPRTYHAGCLSPPWQTVPSGKWSCPKCCEQKEEKPLVTKETILKKVRSKSRTHKANAKHSIPSRGKTCLSTRSSPGSNKSYSKSDDTSPEEVSTSMKKSSFSHTHSSRMKSNLSGDSAGVSVIAECKTKKKSASLSQRNSSDLKMIHSLVKSPKSIGNDNFSEEEQDVHKFDNSGGKFDLPAIPSSRTSKKNRKVISRIGRNKKPKSDGVKYAVCVSNDITAGDSPCPESGGSLPKCNSADKRAAMSNTKKERRLLSSPRKKQLETSPHVASSLSPEVEGFERSVENKMMCNEEFSHEVQQVDRILGCRVRSQSSYIDRTDRIAISQAANQGDRHSERQSKFLHSDLTSQENHDQLDDCCVDNRVKETNDSEFNMDEHQRNVTNLIQNAVGDVSNMSDADLKDKDFVTSQHMGLPNITGSSDSQSSIAHCTTSKVSELPEGSDSDLVKEGAAKNNSKGSIHVEYLLSENCNGHHTSPFTHSSIIYEPKDIHIINTLFKSDKSAEHVTPNQPVVDLRPELIFYEFLVKWLGKSNIHNSWISEEQLKLLAKRKLDNYKTKYGTAIINICEDQWCQPQRIIALRKSDTGGEALIKWNGLPYDECTWEKIDENAVQKSCHLISEFKQFETQALDNDTRHDIVKSEIKKVLSLPEQPKDLKGGLLFPHQLEALNWLRRCWYKSKNVILADEMGLGKTVSACSFISSLYVEFKVKLPCLVLVPLSTMPNWLAEFASWAPHLNVVEYHGCAKARSLIRLHEWHASVSDGSCKRTKSYKFNVLLTTYEMILADSFHLRGVTWELLVVDEGHRLKNSGSKLFSLLNSFSFQHRVLLTGTPLQNNIGEMYNLLNFLQPASFPSLSAFEEKFNDLTTAEKVDELKKLVAPHMLRRLKKDAMQNIPPKSERLVPVELTSVQAEYYRAMLTKNYQVLRNIGKGVAQQSMLNIVMQLRKVCNHPYLIPGTEPESGSMEFLQEMRIKASGKLTLLHSMLKILHKDGHRVLIFSQMTKLLDILEDYLTVEYGHGTYERVDGSISVTDRQAAIARFNKDKTRFVFLLSTRSCGLGINLATADTVFIYDSDFNPHADIQAMNRAHRIGQSKRLLVYRLVVRASVEERILQLAKKKLMLDQLFVNKSGSQKEVEDILRWGTEELFGDCDDTNDQISKDISISKVEDTSFREQKHRRRMGGLGDVYKDKCTDGGAKTVWDENAILKLLDRSDLQTSMSENTDGDLDSDLLGSVKSLEWNDEQPNGEPVGTEIIADLAGDGCGPSATKEFNTNTVTEENEWDRLLRDRWGKYQLEEEATLGRGKRLRKAVSYRETSTSIPTITLIENVHEEEPVKEYSPAGRALREKYMKLRARQKERILRRHTMEVHSSGEGPGSLMQSPVRDSNELQCADSIVHSEDSSELDLLTSRCSDYSTSKLGRISKHDYKRYHGNHPSLSVGSQGVSSDTIPANCVPSSTFLPVLGLCAPNASRRNSTTSRNSTSRILNAPFNHPAINHDQRRTSVGRPEFPFAPVIIGETSTSKNVTGQETTGLSLLSDTPGEALHRRLKNIIPDSYFPFGPPLLPTPGKYRSDPSENLGASFSSIREKMGLPKLVSDEMDLQFAIPSGCSMKLQTDFLPNLSLCSDVKVENGCGKEIPNIPLWQSFEPQYEDALKQKKVMTELPSMLNLGLLQTGVSMPENHVNVLDNIMIKSQTDGHKFLKRKLKVDAWSEDELDALWIGVRRHGKGNWDAIARDPKLKTLKHRSVEELLSKWNEEQYKIMDAPLPLSKISKSGSFHGLSDGMMQRALHSSKFASPGADLPKFRSHLTDIQLGFGDVMPTFPFLEPSSHTGAASESLPFLPSLHSDNLENSFGNFSVGPVESYGGDNLPLEQHLYHSFYSGSIGAAGMNFSSSCIQQDDDVSARNKRMKLPSLLEKSLSLLRETQNIHSEESRMGLLRGVKRKPIASPIDDISNLSKENKLPHWLREAVSAPKPLEVALPPSISAILHSIRILFGENEFTIPPFVIPGPPPLLPKDPRKRLRKKGKLNRLRQAIPGNSSPTGNTHALASCSIPAKSPLGSSSPKAPPHAPSSKPPSPSLAENIISSEPLMPFSIHLAPTLFSCRISSAPLVAPSSIPMPSSLLPSFTTSALPLMPSSQFKFPPSLPMMSSSIHHSPPFMQSSAPAPSSILPASTFVSTFQSSSLMIGSISMTSPTINCSIPADSPPMLCTIPLAAQLTGSLLGITRKDTGFIPPSLNLNLNLPSSSSYGAQGIQSRAIPSPSPAVRMNHTTSVSSISDLPITSNQNLECTVSDNPEYSQVGVDLIGDFNYIPYESEGSYELTCRLPGEMEC